MLIENIYFTLVNSNDEQFPDEISKYVAANDNEELYTSWANWTKHRIDQWK